MMDARNYRIDARLKDGTAVTIRAIRTDDKNRIVEAFKNLDSESVYTRLFRYKRELSEADLKTITEVDFRNTVALVVTLPTGGGEEAIIGGGRYVRYDSASSTVSAEIAFTVEEDYQGQGIASSILRHLIHLAREQGVSQFEADVLPENRSMLSVFARCGLPMKKTLEEGAMHVTLSLSPATP